MTDFADKKIQDRRKQHNQDLIRRMRNGDPLTSFDSKASWYPPRPTITKDKSEIARLYGSSVQKQADMRDSGREPSRKGKGGKSGLGEAG